MLKIKDLYTRYKEYSIDKGTESYGKMMVEYEVREYIDVRDLDTTKKYMINCTQKIMIPNKDSDKISTYDQSSFADYPALLMNKVSLDGVDSSSTNVPLDECVLRNYTPRALNTGISGEDFESTGSVSTQKRHIGSSTSQANDFAFSENIDIATGQQSSVVDATGELHNSPASVSDWMSIKDWGGYTTIDQDNQSPTWVWGQEYPWNVIQFRSDGSSTVKLPNYTQSRLLLDSTNDLVAPPAELAQFGINFVSKASWIVKLSNSQDKVQFTHDLNYAQCSHSATGGVLSVAYDVIFDQESQVADDKFSVTSDLLDLPLLALDPIENYGSRSGAVIGFIEKRFTHYQPAPGSDFEIASNSNNLLLRGKGFPKDPNLKTGLSTDFSDGVVEVDVYFKITDPIADFALVIKSWKTTDVDIDLEMVFNGDIANSVTKQIDSKEGEGAENNLLSVGMRNKDYTSLDYHDYLKMGLNHVLIKITPATPSPPAAGYMMRALAISSSA